MSESASYVLPPEPHAAARARSATSSLVSDVRLFHTPDGGDIEITGGLVTMSDGLETAVYLSLFGGNERDSGLQSDDSLQWWGNLDERDEDKKYRSETQALLRSLDPTPANLRRIEDAVARDLDWLKREIASRLEVSVSIPRLRAISIDVAVTLKSGTKHPFQFETSWGAQR